MSNDAEHAGHARIEPDELHRLVSLAAEMTSRAYAPYSQFHVGCALVTEDGQTFTGCNVENASYGLTICAERNAIFAAVAASEGKPRIRAIAVVNSTRAVCSPCGACRQVIAEFGGRDCVVIFNSSDGIVERTLGELLPDGFYLE